MLNIIWFVLAGWYIALSHLLIAVAEAVSIIGIPFALKDLQLAQSPWPRSARRWWRSGRSATNHEMKTPAVAGPAGLVSFTVG